MHRHFAAILLNGLRDYGVSGQIGLEPSPDEYVAALVAVFREARRVLRDDGTLWLNIGDSYHNYRVHKDGGQPPQGFHKARHGQPETGGRNRGTRLPGIKEKDLIGIPWMLAFALRSDGWHLRSDIIWSKPNPMPESVTDRPTKAHEYLFLLSKATTYYYDADAIAEPAQDWSSGGPGTGILTTEHYGAGNGGNAGLAKIAKRYKSGDAPATRNRRSVWTIPVAPYPGAHFATMPPDLAAPAILAGSPPHGVVLDPFGGTGTTGLVADRLGRDAILIEISPDYARIADRRCREPGFPFGPDKPST